MGKEKHWRGNSKSRIVGIVPGADQGKAKWANRQIISWNHFVHLAAELFRLIVVLMMEIVVLRNLLNREKELNISYREQLARFTRETYAWKGAQTVYANGQIRIPSL